MAAQTWAEYKETFRRTILKDADGLVATDEKLIDAARWAFNGLLPHTALQSTVTYTGDGTTFEFTLPDDVYVPLEQAGLVMITDTSTNISNYLQPAYSTFDVAPTDPKAFYVWPSDTLVTGVVVEIGVDLIVRYYAAYPYVSADDDVMPIPQWAYAAVGYDMGVYLVTSNSWQEAENATDKTKPDSGQPENNSLRQLQAWWIKMNQRELERHPRQNRIVSMR